MRQRRDSFARETYVPLIDRAAQKCSWCGQAPIPRHPLYRIECQSDGGRTHDLTGRFDSWSCAESYNNGRTIGR